MANSFSVDVRAGATSISIPVLLQSSSTFAELPAKLFSDVTASYVRQGAARVGITMKTLASAAAAFDAGGFILVDDTNTPGLYRFDVPDAAFLAGVEWVIIAVKVAGSLVYYERFNLATATTTDVKTDTAAIKLKTDAFPATVGDATAANQTTILANIAAVNAKTTNLPAMPAAMGDAMSLTPGARDAAAAALLDLLDGVETGFTVRQVLRLLAAASAGKISGAAGTTVTLRDLGDTIDRIIATVDSDGDRSALEYDLT